MFAPRVKRVVGQHAARPLRADRLIGLRAAAQGEIDLGHDLGVDQRLASGRAGRSPQLPGGRGASGERPVDPDRDAGARQWAAAVGLDLIKRGQGIAPWPQAAAGRASVTASMANARLVMRLMAPSPR